MDCRCGTREYPRFDPACDNEAHRRLAQPLWKPSRQDAAERRYDRRQERRAEKRAEDRVIRQRRSAVRVDAFRREQGRCRAYGVPLKLVTDNPYELAHSHHIVYRSAGGADSLDNCVILSPQAHRDEHEHRLQIAGDPNGTLTFTKINPETGDVLERWESPRP